MRTTELYQSQLIGHLKLASTTHSVPIAERCFNIFLREEESERREEEERVPRLMRRQTQLVFKVQESPFVEAKKESKPKGNE